MVMLVREKAKQLVALLKDDRKLKEERAKAHTVSLRERERERESVCVCVCTCDYNWAL